MFPLQCIATVNKDTKMPSTINVVRPQVELALVWLVLVLVPLIICKYMGAPGMERVSWGDLFRNGRSQLATILKVTIEFIVQRWWDQQKDRRKPKLLANTAPTNSKLAGVYNFWPKTQLFASRQMLFLKVSLLGLRRRFKQWFFEMTFE